MFECNKANDFDSALALKRYFEVFNLKNGTIVIGKENEGNSALSKESTQVNIKSKIRDHAIWKNEKVWNLLITQGFKLIHDGMSNSN